MVEENIRKILDKRRKTKAKQDCKKGKG